MSKYPDRKLQRERSKEARWARQNQGDQVDRKTLNHDDLTPHNAWLVSQPKFGIEDIRYK